MWPFRTGETVLEVKKEFYIEKKGSSYLPSKTLLKKIKLRESN